MDLLQIFNWLRKERSYQEKKFSYESQAVKEGNDPQYWEDQIGMYLHRATVLGYENPLGLQAMMKALATAVGMAEAVTTANGEPPPPGVPSGEITQEREIK